MRIHIKNQLQSNFLSAGRGRIETYTALATGQVMLCPASQNSATKSQNPPLQKHTVVHYDMFFSFLSSMLLEISGEL